MDFTGKVALVTGGASGIGRASSVAFAKHGAKVVVVDRDAAGGETTVGLIREHGGEAIFVGGEVSRSADVQRFVQTTLDTYGAIDCFHNNAGIKGSFAPLSEYDEESFDEVMAVNVKGIFLGLRHVLPVMLRQGRGAVVNTASIGGLIATLGLPAYVASKHAVIGLTKVAAGEIARSGVRVNAICPGAIATPMLQSREAEGGPFDADAVRARVLSLVPAGRYGTAEEIAYPVLFLCSDMASYITGAEFVVDGGRIATGGHIPKA